MSTVGSSLKHTFDANHLHGSGGNPPSDRIAMVCVSTFPLSAPTAVPLSLFPPEAALIAHHLLWG